MLINELCDLTHTKAGEYLSGFEYPWQAFAGIKNFILTLGKSLGLEYAEIAEGVWVHKSSVIAQSACICAPCIIGENSEVRHCAFIRGGTLVGDGCVVGNSAELKNAVLFDGVQVPHYNYVGDSILGYKAHLGAGAVTSNVKSDKSTVTVKGNGRVYETGLKKFGAILGDFVEVGCGSVLNPGTVIGKNTVIYPLSSVRGIIPADSIYKSAESILRKSGS